MIAELILKLAKPTGVWTEGVVEVSAFSSLNLGSPQTFRLRLITRRMEVESVIKVNQEDALFVAVIESLDLLLSA